MVIRPIVPTFGKSIPWAQWPVLRQDEALNPDPVRGIPQIWAKINCLCSCEPAH